MSTAAQPLFPPLPTTSATRCHPRSSAHCRRAFTLIELLVVIAIISALTGISLPAMSKARGVAWQISSASMQRQLHAGMSMYAYAHAGWIPGINSSGFEASTKFPWDALDRMNQRSDLPVQTFDWITPSVDSDTLPQDRSARMWALFERFADPAMRERVPVFTAMRDAGSVAASDYALAQGRPFHASSFMMPGVWQFFGGPDQRDRITGQLKRHGYPFDASFLVTAQADIPDSYVPRIDNISAPSQKIAIADGFRYLDRTTLDFDARIDPEYYGAFTSSGPIFRRSTAYGIPGSGNPSDGRQLPLSYRHAGKLDATFWDGHVRFLTITESHNPTYWYPSRSIFTGQGAVDDAFIYYQAGDVIQ